MAGLFSEELILMQLSPGRAYSAGSQGTSGPANSIIYQSEYRSIYQEDKRGRKKKERKKERRKKGMPSDIFIVLADYDVHVPEDGFNLINFAFSLRSRTNSFQCFAGPTFFCRPH
jgi:hypothetical protein